MSDGQIGKHKVASGFGAIQIRHANNGRSSEYGDGGRLLITAVSNVPSIFQGGVEKEIARIADSDVVLGVLALKDSQSDDGWWINRPTISRGLVRQ